ncbi:MAG TPA: hypothetical protein PLI07_02025, partial [Candidatus Hydrogenedentes bacterium]|nr:hypothetical protein [Candidatus Hydrogenedentota bacterium]
MPIVEEPGAGTREITCKCFIAIASYQSQCAYAVCSFSIATTNGFTACRMAIKKDMINSAVLLSVVVPRAGAREIT